VVAHSSTIGIEAAAFGRPVVTGSDAYYSGLGFIWKAATLEEYQQLLGEAAAGRLEVTEAMRDDARICFYVTQCCNWVFSVFNPGDYRRWRAQPLAFWHRQPAIQRMLRAIRTDTPVAVFNHEARIAS
jgi:hypothetical protein